MNTVFKTALIIVVPLLLILFAYFFLIRGAYTSGNGWDSYIEHIELKRAEIDNFMRNSDESPFQEKPDQYHSLEYFEPNPDYRVFGDLQLQSSATSATLATSDGNTIDYIVYGKVTFNLGDTISELLLFKMIDPEIEHFFIPFSDLSNGDITYGGGRYLDIDPPVNDKILLDFNLAYNPYCAYTEAYSCPLPPKENDLSVEIQAGEMNYE